MDKPGYNYISVDLAHKKTFHVKVDKGGSIGHWLAQLLNSARINHKYTNKTMCIKKTLAKIYKLTVRFFFSDNHIY